MLETVFDNSEILSRMPLIVGIDSVLLGPPPLVLIQMRIDSTICGNIPIDWVYTIEQASRALRKPASCCRLWALLCRQDRSLVRIRPFTHFPSMRQSEHSPFGTEHQLGIGVMRRFRFVRASAMVLAVASGMEPIFPSGTCFSHTKSPGKNCFQCFPHG